MTTQTQKFKVINHLIQAGLDVVELYTDLYENELLETLNQGLCNDLKDAIEQAKNTFQSEQDCPDMEFETLKACQAFLSTIKSMHVQDDVEEKYAMSSEEISQEHSPYEPIPYQRTITSVNISSILKKFLAEIQSIQCRKQNSNLHRLFAQLVQAMGQVLLTLDKRTGGSAAIPVGISFCREHGIDESLVEAALLVAQQSDWGGKVCRHEWYSYEEYYIMKLAHMLVGDWGKDTKYIQVPLLEQYILDMYGQDAVKFAYQCTEVLKRREDVNSDKRE